MALGGLLAAYRGTRIVGAQFSQVMPGKTAMVWPARALPDEPPAVANRLMATACDALASVGTRVATALLKWADDDDDRLLRAAGFAPLAELLYLAALTDGFPDAPPRSPLEFEPYTAASHARLAAIVQATYDRTLDCPQMNDVREIDDVLEGYRATGQFDPGRWLIVRHQRQDVGCLLLTDHPDHGNWELVYMGLIPSARGSGWGIEIVRYAQWLTRQAGRLRMVLAVDATNEPAVRMYAAAGFRVWDRRKVYVRVFPGQSKRH